MCCLLLGGLVGSVGGREGIPPKHAGGVAGRGDRSGIFGGWDMKRVVFWCYSGGVSKGIGAEPGKKNRPKWWGRGPGGVRPGLWGRRGPRKATYGREGFLGARDFFGGEGGLLGAWHGGI